MKQLIRGLIISITLVGVAYGAYLYIGYSKQQQMITKLQSEVNARLQHPETTPLPLTTYAVWIASWDEGVALNDLRQHPRYYSTILPLWYEITQSGHVSEIGSNSIRQEIISIASASGMKVIGSLTNQFDPDRVSTLLDSEPLQNQAIADLLHIAQTNHFAGWDLDWEEVYPGDQTGLLDFLQMFAEQLHQQGLILSITLQAKTGADTDREIVKAQNWVKIASIADEIRIMAYDFHDSTSDPGPITPLTDLNQVLAYTVKTIPLDKVSIGLPTYGYDWFGKQTEPLQYAEAMNILTSRNIQPQRDSKSGELVAHYRDNLVNHEVWFQDESSISLKIKLVRSYDLSHISLWRLGGEDEKIYAPVTKN